MPVLAALIHLAHQVRHHKLVHGPLRAVLGVVSVIGDVGTQVPPGRESGAELRANVGGDVAHPMPSADRARIERGGEPRDTVSAGTAMGEGVAEIVAQLFRGRPSLFDERLRDPADIGEIEPGALAEVAQGTGRASYRESVDRGSVLCAQRRGVDDGVR